MNPSVFTLLHQAFWASFSKSAEAHDPEGFSKTAAVPGVNQPTLKSLFTSVAKKGTSFGRSELEGQLTPLSGSPQVQDDWKSRLFSGTPVRPAGSSEKRGSSYDYPPKVVLGPRRNRVINPGTPEAQIRDRIRDLYRGEGYDAGEIKNDPELRGLVQLQTIRHRAAQDPQEGAAKLLVPNPPRDTSVAQSPSPKTATDRGAGYWAQRGVRRGPMTYESMRRNIGPISREAFYRQPEDPPPPQNAVRSSLAGAHQRPMTYDYARQNIGPIAREAYLRSRQSPHPEQTPIGALIESARQNIGPNAREAYLRSRQVQGTTPGGASQNLVSATPDRSVKSVESPLPTRQKTPAQKPYPKGALKTSSTGIPNLPFRIKESNSRSEWEARKKYVPIVLGILGGLTAIDVATTIARGRQVNRQIKAGLKALESPAWSRPSAVAGSSSTGSIPYFPGSSSYPPLRP
jgi:hypothetical protein